jgi:hypothetical protein
MFDYQVSMMAFATINYQIPNGDGEHSLVKPPINDG